ncbi:uncharacterized protein GGS22DRAFT_19195 [Annulohypoxylon maeteangense]|uniref:uncharacterized protein n=1 Tax=Annulohypoxylon maeteangense TaxID=1927788 RepID=UPI002008E201|nr:uncharacterized protein GGS22DRAFT_19195 [Annulohypoxylon maeteangense]KAI0884106.1 hypothetical protein GGS22DRAFT_19195 [Annulohypoxylon maeteangense]
MAIVDITRKGDLGGLHLFDITISKADSDPACARQKTSLSVRPPMLLATDTPGVYQTPGGGPDWVVKHVRDMVEALQVRTILPASSCSDTLIIRVTEQISWDSDEMEDTMPVVRVLWELLERLDLWEPSIRPSSVSVIRTIAADAIDQSNETDSKVNKSDGHCDDGNEERPPRVVVLACRAPSGTTTNTDSESKFIRPVFHTILAATEEPNADASTAVGNNTKNITFVRPGSFRALEAELKARPRGYYTTIHLDMEVVHKSKSKIYFQFIKHGKGSFQEIQADLKSASKVGALLALYGVHRVIIIPCPLARSATEAAAAALISAGMCTVVTLAYPAAERSVDLFTRRLYIAHVQQALGLEEAARRARRYLRSARADVGSDGNKVPVCDFIPLVYVDRGWRVPSQTSSHVNINDQSRQYESSNHSQIPYPYGREIDILHIESIFLLGDRLPLLLRGPPGIGKTALLNHLRVWWKASGMIDDSAHLHLATTGPFNKDDILQRLQLHFTQSQTPDRTSIDPLREHLKRHRCLVVLDDLESATLNNQHRLFLNLCSTLSKAGAIVIMASRRREKWLSKASKAYELVGLHTWPATQMVIDSGVSNRVIDIDLPASPSTQEIMKTKEDRDYIDGIVEMVDGNPLVVEFMIRSGLYRSITPRNAYLTLLINSRKPGASSTALDLANVLCPVTKPELPEQFRSVRQLETIFQSLLPAKLGEGFLPALLVSFIGGIPSKDLITLLYIWSTRLRHKLGEAASIRRIRTHLDSPKLLRDSARLIHDAGPALKTLLGIAVAVTSEQSSASGLYRQESDRGTSSVTLASAVVFREDVEFPQQPPAINGLLNAMCDRVKDTLVEAGMLEEIPLADNNRGLMRVNPLVPLFLRREADYVNDTFSIASTAREAFVLYYCYRGKRWPWGYWNHTRGKWPEAFADIEVEFDNFASACLTGLYIISFDTLQLLSLLRIAAVLEHGTGEPKYYYRKNIVLLVWTLALARINVAIAKLEPTDPGSQTELFTLLLAAVYFCSRIGQYEEVNRNSEGANRSRKLISKYAILASMRVPEDEAETTRSLAPKALETVARMAANPDCEIRYNICDYITGHIFERISDPFRAHTPPASSVESLASFEIDLVIMFSVWAEFGRGAKLTKDALTAVQRGDWTAANESLDMTLELELNAEKNDCANRARLVSLQAIVADGQKDFERAKHLREEQSRLEGVAAKASEGEGLFDGLGD